MIISKNYQLHTLFTTRSEALVPVQFLLCIRIRYLQGIFVGPISSVSDGIYLDL